MAKMQIAKIPTDSLALLVGICILSGRLLPFIQKSNPRTNH